MNVSPSALPSPASSATTARWSFLWGKRRSRRHAVALTARLRGPCGSPEGQALDLSRHGAMLRLPTAQLDALEEAPAGSVAQIAALLGDGFELELAEGVSVGARLVRIAWRPEDHEAVYLGCEFVEALDGAALESLGLAPHHCPPEVGSSTPLAGLMTYGADPSRPLELQVLEDDAEAPLAGPLVALQDRAVAIHLEHVDPTAVVARLGGRAHTLCVALPGAGTWTSQAYLLAVRLLDERDDAVEVVLTTTTPPSLDLLARLRRRKPASTRRRDRR